MIRKYAIDDDAYYADGDELQRTYWMTTELVDDTYGHEVRSQVKPEDANLVCSLLRNGQHAPALDIDFPCKLLPSSTEGHFHLYIDKPMSWKAYKKLLRALRNAGLVEPGYYRASVRRSGTDLRKPGVVKMVEGRTRAQERVKPARQGILRRRIHHI